jgi:hypothetical protein
MGAALFKYDLDTDDGGDAKFASLVEAASV